EEFHSLLGQAIGFAGGDASRVIVLSIPDWGVTPFGDGRDRALIGREIDAFNDINREEAVQAGAYYVDTVAVSREAGTNPALTVADGLHPSGVLYGRWARLAVPAARAALIP
ncbi:MAG: SGNH/GDSL hydrolase family protein, partial [Anaerolineaceae bacterium]